MAPSYVCAEARNTLFGAIFAFSDAKVRIIFDLASTSQIFPFFFDFTSM